MNEPVAPSLHHIHDLTSNYSDRQGLRIVPVGVLMILQCLPRPYDLAGFFGFDVVLTTLVVGLLGYYGMGRWYRHRFGVVEEMPHEGAPIALQIVVVFVCFMVGVAIDIFAKPPVLVAGLLIAAWLIAAAWPSRHIRGQYLSAGVVLALVSLMPLVGESRAATGRIYGFMFGAMLLLAGVRDHVQFVRLFPPMETQHE